MTLILNDYSYSESVLAEILSVSKKALVHLEDQGQIKSTLNQDTGKKEFNIHDIKHMDAIQDLLNSTLLEELKEKPCKEFTSIELFAGAGGLALGLENAGFKHVLLNEIDRHATNTLKHNRPHWNIINDDISHIDFTPYRDKIDLISGGFPCQSFSYAGKKKGFADTRGTLFFEFARAIQEVQPKILLGENVRGLKTHENGDTLETIKNTIKELGYSLIEPQVLKAIYYRVPQKRERLFLIAIRNDLVEKSDFSWPSKHNRVMTLKDGLKAGELFKTDVEKSAGQTYPQRKKEIMDLVPAGGYWKDLSDELQREYMKGSYFLGGGKTGVARRLSWFEPSLTLTCSPAQKQTERCHPEETRPLTYKEYARIQTFPDDWEFQGSLTNKYKQIGNAVPVNLSHAVGSSIVRMLNKIYA